MAKKLLNVEIDNRDNSPQTSRYRNSRYFKREIRRNVFFIEPDTWVPPTIPVSPSDLVTKVGSGEGARLDLVSLRVYGTDRLWWVLAYANNIIDPFQDVVEGMVLKYPPFSVVVSRILV